MTAWMAVDLDYYAPFTNVLCWTVVRQNCCKSEEVFIYEALKDKANGSVVSLSTFMQMASQIIQQNGGRSAYLNAVCDF